MDAKISRGMAAAVRALCGCVLLASFCFVVTGCGGATAGRQVSPTGTTTTSDQDKIKGHLDAAGIKGDIYTIVDNGNQWIVDVGVPTPAPAKGRAPPPTPVTYLVDKASGKVTSSVNKQ